MISMEARAIQVVNFSSPEDRRAKYINISWWSFNLRASIDIYYYTKMYIRLIDKSVMTCDNDIQYRPTIIAKWLKPFMKTKGL